MLVVPEAGGDHPLRLGVRLIQPGVNAVGAQPVYGAEHVEVKGPDQRVHIGQLLAAQLAGHRQLQSCITR